MFVYQKVRFFVVGRSKQCNKLQVKLNKTVLLYGENYKRKIELVTVKLTSRNRNLCQIVHIARLTIYPKENETLIRVVGLLHKLSEHLYPMVLPHSDTPTNMFLSTRIGTLCMDICYNQYLLWKVL